MINKNTLVASALTAALGFSSFAAQAADPADQTGTVQFIGVISSVTCKVDVIDENGNKMNVIDLGTAMASDPEGEKRTFKLKADDTDGSGCNTDLTSGTTVKWFGAFDANGLQNTDGSASNWYVAFGPQGEPVFNTNNGTEEFYSVTDVGTPAGFDVTYEAQMVKSGTEATPGDVSTIVKYTVQYQ